MSSCYFTQVGLFKVKNVIFGAVIFGALAILVLGTMHIHIVDC